MEACIVMIFSLARLDLSADSAILVPLTSHLLSFFLSPSSSSSSPLLSLPSSISPSYLASLISSYASLRFESNERDKLIKILLSHASLSFDRFSPEAISMMAESLRKEEEGAVGGKERLGFLSSLSLYFTEPRYGPSRIQSYTARQLLPLIYCFSSLSSSSSPSGLSSPPHVYAALSVIATRMTELAMDEGGEEAHKYDLKRKEDEIRLAR